MKQSRDWCCTATDNRSVRWYNCGSFCSHLTSISLTSHHPPIYPCIHRVEILHIASAMKSFTMKSRKMSAKALRWVKTEISTEKKVRRALHANDTVHYPTIDTSITSHIKTNESILCHGFFNIFVYSIRVSFIRIILLKCKLSPSLFSITADGS